MKEVIKRYSNGEIVVVWQPAKCIHSKLCFHGLSDVFDPNQRPWVNVEGSDTAAISKQVQECPSGALSIEKADVEEVEAKAATTVNVLPNGPLILQGDVLITGTDGTATEKSGAVALCRCGASANKPYCDGSHAKIDFKDA